MLFLDIELPGPLSRGQLTKTMAGIAEFDCCEVPRTSHYAGFIWLPHCAALRCIETDISAKRHARLHEGYRRVWATITHPTCVGANTSEYAGVLHVNWHRHSFGGEACVASKDAFGITEKIEAVLPTICRHVVRNADGEDDEICVGIRPALQGQRRKRDGSYVADGTEARKQS
ncbi:hypothetical protein DOTSEDRAFT_39472 [Dothistroma septosporum NZE10]|uniref:Uncharacterized protein n=1 Tax=Dothistroma septosporum (strain NZE10 / CBS 128990) TaxID=675120 RepID=N1PBW4_DOTSN|nr:hypothetical protein DOTSEDRAFT_39472 [Dothistroma septosporum NZE10]